MPKQILFDKEAREKVLSGVKQLAKAVGSTLGPKGKTVIYFRPGMYSPVATKDGVTVAREIHLPDPIENCGAMMVKEVAAKTAEEAGDGTTTASLLAEAIIEQGLHHVNNGANPVDIKKGIDRAVGIVVEELKKQAIEVDDEKILNIATISANNDEIIGKLISDAMKAVGKEGIIKVQDSKGFDNELKVVEGMEFDRGFLSPYFKTNYAKNRCELERPAILIIDKRISHLDPKWLTLLNTIVEKQIPLFIICNDMDGEALTSFSANHHNKTMKVCVVRVPGYTEDQQAEYMEDIATLTGGQIVGDERGLMMDQVSLEHLGGADSVTVTQNITTIIGGKGNAEAVASRISGIKATLENCADERERSVLKSRMAKLSGKVAVLHIGAGSEIELGEKKDRVDDALQATRAAVEEGVIVGGGVAYIRAIDAVKNIHGANKDERAGINIISRAIEQPMRHIVQNSVGINKKTGWYGWLLSRIFESKADRVVATVKEGKYDWGYNARTEVYENLIVAGVIDPVKVARVALQNAASVANTVLTTECLIVEVPEKVNV